MEEVLTCKCGNQKWVVLDSGFRCVNCKFLFTPNDAKHVSELNRIIKKTKRPTLDRQSETDSLVSQKSFLLGMRQYLNRQLDRVQNNLEIIKKGEGDD